MKRGAAIIATSSETGIMGSKELPDYSATKGAINAFTKTLAQELIDARHSRQCGCAGSGVDAAESVGRRR